MKASWTFSPVREFVKLRERWQEINLAGPASPLLDPQFLLPLIEHFADAASCSRFAGTGSPDAMAILRRAGAGRWA